MVDQVPTPPELAAAIVERAKTASAGCDTFIADFAAGDGSLLSAAAKRWPKAEFIATDLDASAISSLRAQYSSWHAGQCDFLSPTSRAECGVLQRALGKVAVALLNPPFSCRGGTRAAALLGDHNVQCSIAMAFLLNTVSYLTPEGEMLAIVPVGSLDSEKDRDAWAALRRHGATEVVAKNGHRTFLGHTLRTAVVHFRRQGGVELSVQNNDDGRTWNPTGNGRRVSIIRGTLQMHEISSLPGAHRVPLVHSTELKDTGVDLRSRASPRASHAISGPMVLMPRVGAPNVGKVRCHFGKEAFDISDCVIALVCECEDDAGCLHSALVEHWHNVEAAYTGSCARYITVSRISHILKALGFDPVVVPVNSFTTGQPTRVD